MSVFLSILEKLSLKYRENYLLFNFILYIKHTSLLHSIFINNIYIGFYFIISLSQRIYFK